MKTLMTWILPALLAAHCSLPLCVGQTLSAQEAQPDTSIPVFNTDELVLRYLRPHVADSKAVATVMNSFYSRLFYVQAEDGSVSGPVQNIQAFGDAVMIYDTPKFVERLTAALTDIEAAADASAGEATSGRQGALKLAEYAPRYQPVANLFRALASYQHDVVVGRLDKGFGKTQFQYAESVTQLDEPAMLILRDEPANVDEMLALLRRMDTPAPQVLVTVWLLRGSDGSSASPLPKDLTENLARLVPYEDFTRVSVSVLRMAVDARDMQMIRGTLADGDHFDLALRPGGYDAEARQLTLTNCEFSANNRGFKTSTVVKTGEYTVLGATGSDPILVVLHVAPLDN